MPRVSRTADPETIEKRDESPVDIAFRKIKEMLYNHEIVPGQKLLYHELARKLDMSITPIIQALNRLQLLNIVTSEPNKGYYVGEADPREAEELFEALEAVESYLLPSIVQNVTKKRLDAIERSMKEYGKAASAPQHRRHLMVRDTNFHLRIIECSGNKVITNLCRMIFEQIYLKYRPEYMLDDRLKEAAEEHRMILSALRDRDEKRIARLLKQHGRNAREHVVGSIRRETDLDIPV